MYKQMTSTQKMIFMILGTLIFEFVLGVLLTTVIAYDPSSPNGFQTTILVLHMIVGAVLFFGGFIHLLNSRGTHIGPTPVIGFSSIVGAFVTGGIAAGNGSDIAVLLMALFFSAAIVAYGINYATSMTKKST